MGTITIRLLGGFHVTVDGISADEALARSPKGATLLQRLLIACGETVPAAELIRILDLRSVGALKTLVSRTRTLLAGASPDLAAQLCTSTGGYYWASSDNVTVDVQAFEQLSSVLHDCRELTPVSRAWFDMAMALYQGNLLADRAAEEWLTGKALSLQTLYLAAVQRYLNLLQTTGDLNEMVRVCRRAMALLPFNEGLRLRLADIMTQMKDLDAPPESKALIRETLPVGPTLDEQLIALRARVTKSKSSNAIVCDNVIFHEVCMLTMRTLARTGAPVGLGLVRLSLPDGAPLPPMAQDLVMEQLVQLMARHLRRGDVVCRVAEDQVAVLLPTAVETRVQIVLERLIRFFYEEHSPDDLLLACRATTL